MADSGECRLHGSWWTAAAVSALLGGLVCAPPVMAASGEDFRKPEPQIPENVEQVPHDPDIFKADPTYEDKPYDPEKQLEIYGGKTPIDEPRPVLELGRPFYREGPFRAASDLTGTKNLFAPNLRIYGDWRNELTYNDNGDPEVGQIATRLNLDVDMMLTATERLHAFFQPLDKDGSFTRCEFSGGDSIDDCELELDGNPETFFFEGDLARMAESVTGEYNSYDMPFAAGLVPFVVQNGIWMEDAFIGGAYAIPAQNSPPLDISNMDITFFAGFDEVDAPGILDGQGQVANHNVNVYGVTTFIDAMEGYWEIGAGHADGEAGLDDQSYSSVTAAFTKRYGGWLSNSIRGFWTFGQDRDAGQQNADGFALLVENSLITEKPLTLVPYVNGWIGLDRPQPLANGAGLLQNTGIAFDAAALTNFPTLDDTAHNTFGASVGVEYLFDLDQQIVVEATALQVIDGANEPGRPAVDDQYALALRYQIPIARDWIIRTDAIYGWLDGAEDIAGVRAELRWKF